MAAPRRIGILTGGGDVPGLNSVIKSVVYRATDLGYEVVGIRRGWEGLTHQRRGRRARPRVRADPGPDQHADHRPHRRHDPPLVAHQPAQDAAKALPAWLDAKTVADKEIVARASTTSPTTCSRRSSTSGSSHLVTIGGDDTLSFSSALYERGAAARRDPQDDGQRRQRDRVLHRLLVGDHPGQGGPQPAAHDARLARADRRVPDLRARRRVHRAVHGVRDLEPVRDPRVPVRHRGAGRDPQGGPREQPQPLRDRDHRRGRDLGGRPDQRRRRGRRLRPPPQDERGRGRWRPRSGR